MLRKEIIRLELNPIPIITDLNIINELLNIEESNKQAFINGIYFQEIIINSEFDINNKTSYHYKHRFYKINESGEKIISYENPETLFGIVCCEFTNNNCNRTCFKQKYLKYKIKYFCLKYIIE